MKKKVRIWGVAAIALLAVLVIPIPSGPYKDGGTREYTALTYKIVDWNRLTGEAVYDETRIYLFPNNFKSVDALWEQEQALVGKKMLATVLYMTDTTAVVESVEDGKRYSIQLAGTESIGAAEGSVVEITYSGALLYSDPAVIVNVMSWKLLPPHRNGPALR